jgi:hypothetical protein
VGWTKIRHALTELVKADKARGITTRVYALDSAAEAQKVHAQVVTTPTDGMAIKAAVDQIYAAWQPAYVVLVGGPDLVGTVSLTNPLWTGDPADDPDQFIPSDLLYACDNSGSLSPADYRGPTRVVGRLPDLIGDADPGVLVSLLTLAAQATSLVRRSPEPAFAVSAGCGSAPPKCRSRACPTSAATCRRSRLTDRPGRPRRWARPSISSTAMAVSSTRTGTASRARRTGTCRWR